MRNKLKLSTVGALFLFVLSCNQGEDAAIEKFSPPETEKSSILSRQYSNVGNPYEYVGENHNLFLEYRSSQNPADCNGNISLVMDFSNQVYSDVDASDNLSYDEVLNAVNYSLSLSFTDQIEQTHNQGRISDVVYNEVLKLADIYSNANETEGIDALVQKIEDLEKSFLLLNLTEDDEPILLSVISIAKYSANYWREVYYEHPTQWNHSVISFADVMTAGAAGALEGAAKGASTQASSPSKKKKRVAVRASQVSWGAGGCGSTYFPG